MTCKFEDCDREVRAKGLCSKHYQRQRDGRPMEDRPRQRAKTVNVGACAFDGCDRPAFSKGLCSGHYKQQNKGQELTPLGVRPVHQVQPCSFEGCERPLIARGLCSGHYQQHTAGEELRPLRSYAPRDPSKAAEAKRKAAMHAQVRQWARENGIDVPERGRIPWQVMEAWRQATDSQ